MEGWNAGKMEYWGLTAEFMLILISVLLDVSKNDFILLNPLFQSSNIPLFHVIGLRHSQFTLTWTRGTGFRC